MTPELKQHLKDLEDALEAAAQYMHRAKLQATSQHEAVLNQLYDISPMLSTIRENFVKHVVPFMEEA